MCVIIHKPKGVILPESMVAKSWRGNPHGAGFISIKEGEKTMIGKGYMTYPDFSRVVEDEDLMSEDIESVLHFRIATHGSINASNTHPFYNLEKNIALCHNGILCEFGSNKLSDTKDLFESVIAMVDAKARSKVLHSLSGRDKFILFNEGRLERYGEWAEYEGSFYSNDFNLPYVPREVTPIYQGVTASTSKFCDECRMACTGGYRESEGYTFCDDCYNDWFGMINE